MVLAPGVAPAQQTTANGTLVDDTTIYEEVPGDNGGGNPDFCVGNLQMASMTRRGLIRYDLPDIPPGATVDRVTLDLRQDRVRSQGTGPKSAVIELRRITEDWTEGQGNDVAAGPCAGGTASAGVTWTAQPMAQTAASAEASFGTGGNSTIVLDSNNADDAGLVADVQAWVDGTPNHGWMVSVADENDPDNSRWMQAGSLSVTWTTEATPTFTINPGLNDAWYEPATDGQGFYFVIFPDLELMSLAWFTYDTERPPADVTATVGEPGHRWVTALGPYEGDTAMLDVILTSGGVFDMPMPDDAPDPDAAYGTMTVVFNDCNTAELTYDFPGPGVQGTIPLQRIVPDNAAFCEMFQEGTGTR
jgi:hypothetical protein